MTPTISNQLSYFLTLNFVWRIIKTFIWFITITLICYSCSNKEPEVKPGQIWKYQQQSNDPFETPPKAKYKIVLDVKKGKDKQDYVLYCYNFQGPNGGCVTYHMSQTKKFFLVDSELLTDWTSYPHRYDVPSFEAHTTPNAIILPEK